MPWILGNFPRKEAKLKKTLDVSVVEKICGHILSVFWALTILTVDMCNTLTEQDARRFTFFGKFYEFPELSQTLSNNIFLIIDSSI